MMQNNDNNRDLHKKAAGLLGEILDTGSLVEYFAPSKCGVVSGYGTMGGRLVFVFMQYSEINQSHARKISSLYKSALNMGAPVIAVLDSEGVNMQTANDGLEAFAAYGEIFTAMTDASGIIPQISIVLGDCFGTASYIPSLSDFVFMSGDKSTMFLNSPATLPGLDGKIKTFGDLGGADAHAANTGIAHFTYNDNNELFAGVKELLTYLPSNNLDEVPLTISSDDLNRIDEAININGKGMLSVISSVSDSGRFLEVKKQFASDAVTCFACLNGLTVGMIGISNTLTPAVCDKVASFVCFCDAFNIPIVTLQDVSGGYSFGAQTHGDMLKSGSRMLSSFISATVPKINITIGDTFGAPFLLLNSKPAGADISFLWDTAQSGVMKKETAQKIVSVTHDTSSEFANGLFTDNVIKPASTRKYLISALETLSSKRVLKNAKKHASIIH